MSSSQTQFDLYDGPSSQTQFGLPLDGPSSQTLLPVMEKNYTTTVIRGFYPITKTVFTGAETTFAVQAGPGGAVAIESITMPTKVDDGRGYGVKQFMAATYDYEEAKNKPWLGYAGFISADNSGYYSRWATPSNTWMHSGDLGMIVKSLEIGMDIITVTPPGAPVPPPGTDATLRWAASVNLSSLSSDCAFFDFNWWSLFKATPPASATAPNQVVPLTISTVSNPPGNLFKAAILQQQTIVPGGGAVFDTIRIIRMDADIVAGVYEFEFSVSWVNAGVNVSTPVSLGLTVV